MDKYEYKVRADEIKALIAKKRYAEAVKIADSVDWTRVRSVIMLCTISDLYKINRRLQESRDILLLAYERNPNGRTIVYSLCELSIKLGDVVQAIEYYKMYVQLAPKDTGKYILQYKLYEAQEVSLEERIAVLEEFKKRDYREKWAYELAYLYHRVGLATRCVEECDDLILWFGEGKYVIKAMELKMLHEPLTSVQQKKYNSLKGARGQKAPYAGQNRDGGDTSIADGGGYAPEEQYNSSGDGQEAYGAGGYEAEAAYGQQDEMPVAEPDMDIQVKPMRVGKYDTINLQKELAENMKEILMQEEGASGSRPSMVLEEIPYSHEDRPGALFEEEAEPAGMTQEIARSMQRDNSRIRQVTQPAGMAAEKSARYEALPVYAEETGCGAEEYPEEAGYSTEEYSKEAGYGTGEYPEETGYSMGEYPEEAGYGTGEYPEETGYSTGEYPEETGYSTESPGEGGCGAEEYPEEAGYNTVKYPEEAGYGTEEYPEEAGYSTEESPGEGGCGAEEYPEEAGYDTEEYPEEAAYHTQGGQPEESYSREEAGPPLNSDETVNEPQAEEIFFEDHTSELPRQDELDPRIAGMLSQEYDGQISLVVPDAEAVEKQITGQMSIEDILAEWERLKKENERKRAEAVRKRVLEQTGSMFSEFDASARNGILEQLEEAARQQEQKEKAGNALLNAAHEDFDAESQEVQDANDGLEELYDMDELPGTGEDSQDAETEYEEKIVDGEIDGDQTEEEGEYEEEPYIEEAEDIGEAYDEEISEGEAPPAIEEEGGGAEDYTAEEELPEETYAEEAEDICMEGTEAAVASGEKQEKKQANADSAAKESGQPADKEETKDPAEAVLDDEGHEVPKSRSLTEAEEEVFGNYIQTKKEKSQIVHALDTMTLAPYTGNVIITGDTGVDKVGLAKDLIKEVKQSDSNFSGKVAKITGKALNRKDVEKTLSRISNGALIIERAGELKPDTLAAMNKTLEKDNGGIIILMEDTHKAIDLMLEGCEAIKGNFNARIDIEALSNDALVAYGRKYANELEYSIDDLGSLALYTRVADMQTSEHTVTAAEVRDIIDEAINSANRKNLGHFKDLLLAKRYDEEDMIVLREKDFLAF